MKTCSKCKETKSFKEFYKKKTSPSGFHGSCKRCDATQKKAYNQRNKEKIAIQRKAYREEHKEQSAIANKAWVEKNRDRYNAVQTIARIKRKASGKCIWADKEKIAMKYKIARILSGLISQKCEVDHIIPLAGKNICGLHHEDNLQILSARENRLKSNKVYANNTALIYKEDHGNASQKDKGNNRKHNSADKQ